MSIVERSSDNDYSSSNSSSSAGENLDEFIKRNVQSEEVQGYRFQPRWASYNSESSESLEAQMEEADEDVALAWLGNLNW